MLFQEDLRVTPSFQISDWESEAEGKVNDTYKKGSNTDEFLSLSPGVQFIL